MKSSKLPSLKTKRLLSVLTLFASITSFNLSLGATGLEVYRMSTAKWESSDYFYLYVGGDYPTNNVRFIEKLPGEVGYLNSQSPTVEILGFDEFLDSTNRVPNRYGPSPLSVTFVPFAPSQAEYQRKAAESGKDRASFYLSNELNPWVEFLNKGELVRLYSLLASKKIPVYVANTTERNVISSPMEFKKSLFAYSMGDEGMEKFVQSSGSIIAKCSGEKIGNGNQFNQYNIIVFLCASNAIDDKAGTKILSDPSKAFPIIVDISRSFILDFGPKLEEIASSNGIPFINLQKWEKAESDKTIEFFGSRELAGVLKKHSMAVLQSQYVGPSETRMFEGQLGGSNISTGSLSANQMQIQASQKMALRRLSGEVQAGNWEKVFSETLDLFNSNTIRGEVERLLANALPLAIHEKIKIGAIDEAKALVSNFSASNRFSDAVEHQISQKLREHLTDYYAQQASAFIAKNQFNDAKVAIEKAKVEGLADQVYDLESDLIKRLVYQSIQQLRFEDAHSKLVTWVSRSGITRSSEDQVIVDFLNAILESPEEDQLTTHWLKAKFGEGLSEGSEILVCGGNWLALSADLNQLMQRIASLSSISDSKHLLASVAYENPSASYWQMKLEFTLGSADGEFEQTWEDFRSDSSSRQKLMALGNSLSAGVLVSFIEQELRKGSVTMEEVDVNMGKLKTQAILKSWFPSMTWKPAAYSGLDPDFVKVAFEEGYRVFNVLSELKRNANDKNPLTVCDTYIFQNLRTNPFQITSFPVEFGLQELMQNMEGRVKTEEDLQRIRYELMSNHLLPTAMFLSVNQYETPSVDVSKYFMLLCEYLDDLGMLDFAVYGRQPVRPTTEDANPSSAPDASEQFQGEFAVFPLSNAPASAHDMSRNHNGRPFNIRNDINGVVFQDIGVPLFKKAASRDGKSEVAQLDGILRFSISSQK